MTFSFSAPRIEEDEVAKEIQSLSPEDLDQAYRDIYGESVIPEESPQMIAWFQMNLHTALQSIPAAESAAYRNAVEICPHYASSDDFMLMFLRATAFDVQAAAIRITSYWREKVILFGEERAFRKLSLQEMTDDEYEIALRCGGIQILPGTDSAGRGLLYYDRAKWDSRSSHRASMLRTHWYLLHSLAERNPSVQKNGLVIIGYTSPNTELDSFDRKMVMNMFRQWRFVLPIRVVASHHVIRSSVVRFIMPLAYFIIGAKLRARYRPHVNMSDQQIVETLKEFGLSAEQLPVDIGGQFRFDYDYWRDTQEQIERTEA